MADVDRLLIETSRTFALAIPRLPEPLRREVGVAYLLFRIADTFEDATRWPKKERIGALAEFDELLKNPTPGEAKRLADRWVKARPCDHEGYLNLLAETPGVMDELAGFAPTRRAAIIKHTLRTSEGMAGFVASGGEDGSLRLASLRELKHYCFIVAGIVGELLTDLFLDFTPSLATAKKALWDNAIQFGEGLQLVNILKDANSDAKDGRVYLPPGLPRSDILALAREDLRCATDYVLALQTAGAPQGVVSFTALPVVLAEATLRTIEQHGSGKSISRADVMTLVGRLDHALESGAPALA